MHEFGHTIDSKRLGLAYLFAVGIPSLISAGTNKDIPGTFTTTHRIKPYEMRATTYAEEYFGAYYGISWSYPYQSAIVRDYYPTY